jgi:predicted enzyme related to lactoylglutathione lyase
VVTLELARVIIFAKDMDKMASFYGDVVGLPRADTVNYSPEFLSFDAGGAHIALHSIPEEYARNIEIANPPLPRESTPIKVAFRVENVHQARAQLESRGAELGPVREFGTLHLCDGTDPEGNIFQLSNRS